MTEARLKARLVVQAAVRLCAIRAVPIVVTRRGDPDAGTILVRIDRREFGCEVLAQTRTPSGEPAWLRATGEAPVEAAVADAYLARQVARDPDVWIVEIEDRDARPVFDGRIL